MEPQEIYDTPEVNAKTVGGVKAFISQFNSNPIMGLPKKDNVPVPQIKPKPTLPKSINKGPQVIPSGNKIRTNLKPVIPEKKIVEPPKIALKPVKLVTKNVNNANIEQQNHFPQRTDSFKKYNDKENIVSSLDNKQKNDISSLRNKFNATTNNKSDKSAVKPSPQNKRPDRIEYVDDKVFNSPAGKKYRMIKLPENFGTPPVKPNVPEHVDLYDFQVSSDAEEDLYESYDDVVVPSNSAVRPVSMIPELTEEEEMTNTRKSLMVQESYDDTEVPDRVNRTVSLIDEEVYEEFSDKE